MKLHRFALAALALAAFVTPAAADDTGAFVLTLGQDTTSVDRYVRTANKLEVFQVGRAPRVLKRHFVYDLDKAGNVTKFSMVVQAPGSDTPTQKIDGTFNGTTVLKVVDGRIVEEIGLDDGVAALTQLGLVKAA